MLGALVALCLATPLGAQPRAVYLVRHAEKASATDPDPMLSEAGAARARALADSLAGAGIQQVIVSPRRRTGDTAAPLVQRLGIPVVTVALSATHVADVAAAVRRAGPGAVLVVGHSNTIPAIVGALGGPKLPDLCDASYDTLFVVRFEGSTTIVERRRLPDGQALYAATRRQTTG